MNKQKQKISSLKLTIIGLSVAAVMVVYAAMFFAFSGHGHAISYQLQSGKYDKVLAVFGIPCDASDAPGGCTCALCCKA